ncbi:MAG: hypothetical protein SOZ81_10705, partial [Agathobacter sp.]|nr:hypothetical protein [Agathobacter sp.]
RVLNVNDGHNAELMNKCKRLMHYAQFIARINQNIDAGMLLQNAIDEAISYCLENGILTDVLIRNRSEVRHMLLTEFNEKKFAKTMWEEGHESGYSSGYSEGRESGYHEILKVMDEINKGNDTLDKLVSLGYDEELVKQVLEKK